MPKDLTRRQMIALTGAALCLGQPAKAAAPTRTMEGRAFASHWRITAPAEIELEQHRPAIEALLARIDQQMSPWRDDSELTRFNSSQAGCAVSGALALVAQTALEIAQESNGWFDPTVGPLVAQWGFGPIKGGQSGAWQGLAAQGGGLHKAAPDLTMDLCGIAKGRALDLMAAHLLQIGVQDFLVDLGGELKAAGQHPSGRQWHVAVEDPRQNHDAPALALRLPSGLSVATSGFKAQSYVLGQSRYGHIIDPRRARPATGALASVSVLAADAMRADAWATALLAAGEAGPQLAQEQGLAALFLSDHGGALSHIATGGFDRHLL